MLYYDVCTVVAADRAMPLGCIEPSLPHPTRERDVLECCISLAGTDDSIQGLNAREFALEIVEDVSKLMLAARSIGVRFSFV